MLNHLLLIDLEMLHKNIDYIYHCIVVNCGNNNQLNAQKLHIIIKSIGGNNRNLREFKYTVQLEKTQ